MAELRITQLQDMALFDDKLAGKILRASIMAKLYPKVISDKKSAKLYTLDFKKTNTNLRVKIQQNTNKSKNLKQRIK